MDCAGPYRGSGSASVRSDSLNLVDFVVNMEGTGGLYRLGRIYANDAHNYGSVNCMRLLLKG